jgi:hypothetical protein
MITILELDLVKNMILEYNYSVKDILIVLNSFIAYKTRINEIWHINIEN